MKTLLLIIALFFSFALHAQKNYNPYASIGKKGKMLTLSNGKYNELELYDSLQHIGSAIINMNTGKIYKLLPVDTIQSTIKNDPTVISRWYSLDPLQAKYPSLSPYNFVGNSPLMFVDPDGKIIKPVNPDGNKAIDAMLRSFIKQNKNDDINKENVYKVFGIRGNALKGYTTDRRDDNLAPIGPEEFRKVAIKNGVDKSNVEDAYTVYLALASNKTIEVEVYSAGQNPTTTKPGEEPTVIVPSIP